MVVLACLGETLRYFLINTVEEVRTGIEVCWATDLTRISVVFPALGICHCLCFKTVQLVRINGDTTRV